MQRCVHAPSPGCGLHPLEAQNSTTPASRQPYSVFWRGWLTERTLNFTYSLTDRIIRLSLGEFPDFSGAMFDGDFSLTLEQARVGGCLTWVAAGVRYSPTRGHAAGSEWG